MTEFFVCFSCCIGEQPQPKRRRRIDRSMIGEPMNFVHTSHVGLGDASVGFSAFIPGSDEIERWICKRCVGQGTALTAGLRWGKAQITHVKNIFEYAIPICVLRLQKDTVEDFNPCFVLYCAHKVHQKSRADQDYTGIPQRKYRGQDF